MIPALQWHVLYDAFAVFAARQYHFYDDEVGRMEDSVFKMSPYPKRRKDDKA